MPDHLILKNGIWHARLDIPQDVRHHEDFLAKKVLTKSLRTGSRQEAKDSCRQVIASWKSQIKAIREGKGNKVWMIEASEAQTKYIQALKDAKTGAELLNAQDDAAVDWVKIVRNHGLNNEERHETHSIIINKNPAKNPISPTLINEFETHQENNFVVKKTAAVQAANMRKLAKYLESHNLTLTHESVASYLDSLTVSTKTKQQKLFAGNSFWNFLTSKNKNLRTSTNPFKDHSAHTTKKGKNRDEENSYAAFSPEEVESLYKLAIEKNDLPLATSIKIGAYTGCRIEEICKLTKDSIENGQIIITKAKTKKGNREIPIHSSLSNLIETLCEQSRDGYLIKSSGGNKYDVRSDSISKRFGRLKKQQGYGREHVFHSIRKTVTTMLHHAEVPPLTTTALLGHKSNHITFDIYSSGPSPKQKKDAIEKLKFNLD